MSKLTVLLYCIIPFRGSPISIIRSLKIHQFRSYFIHGQEREREKGMKANCYKIVIIFIPRYCYKRSQVHLINIQGYRWYFCERGCSKGRFSACHKTAQDQTFCIVQNINIPRTAFENYLAFHNGQLSIYDLWLSYLGGKYFLKFWLIYVYRIGLKF